MKKICITLAILATIHTSSFSEIDTDLKIIDQLKAAEIELLSDFKEITKEIELSIDEYRNYIKLNPKLLKENDLRQVDLRHRSYHEMVQFMLGYRKNFFSEDHYVLASPLYLISVTNLEDRLIKNYITYCIERLRLINKNMLKIKFLYSVPTFSNFSKIRRLASILTSEPCINFLSPDDINLLFVTIYDLERPNNDFISYLNNKLSTTLKLPIFSRPSIAREIPVHDVMFHSQFHLRDHIVKNKPLIEHYLKNGIHVVKTFLAPLKEKINKKPADTYWHSEYSLNPVCNVLRNLKTENHIEFLFLTSCILENNLDQEYLCILNMPSDYGYYYEECTLPYINAVIEQMQNLCSEQSAMLSNTNFDSELEECKRFIDNYLKK
ncbi:MAG: hypothetical protein NZM04_04085 [Methylacidiphilales bacterium]|nr:hypothetical protein [Candidatus Methylacidiphilales bacterium]MDW8350222.1 hypothetical protein [Verrucomicrobiae bacterium]